MNKTSRINGGGRAWKITLGVIVGLLVLLGALYAWDYFSNKDNVPRGTSVGGVEIGGMSHAEAEETLLAELGGVENEPVTLTAGDLSSQLVPAESGLAINWQETVAQTGTESANPIERIRGLLTTTEVSVVSEVDDAALAPQIDRAVEELSSEPTDGGLTIEGAEIVRIDPEMGQTVDSANLATEVSADWLNPEGVTVEPVVVKPAINDDVIDEAADGVAATAVSGPLVVHGQNDVTGTIGEDRIGEIVSFNNVEGSIEPEVNLEVATSILAEQLADSETEPVNARIATDGSVTPHTDGTLLDWETTMEGFEERLLGDEPREWEAAYEPAPAEYTAEDAQNATFDQVVGEFTTEGFSAASGTNIAVMSNQVSGAIVGPGETFSLNGHTGPRGTAQGYVESGIIENGRSSTGVGGGASQYTTTLYNAAYFAGMEDVAHTPHSYYISRYPAGREATIWEGAIDLVFRNTSDHPVRIESTVGDNSVTVRLMGVKTVNVESVNGGRWAETQPQVQEISGDNCIPSSGIPGFTTSDTRIISDLGGSELTRETQTTVYDPQPIVRCTG